jgi:hypothetical protein
MNDETRAFGGLNVAPSLFSCAATANYWITGIEPFEIIIVAYRFSSLSSEQLLCMHMSSASDYTVMGLNWWCSDSWFHPRHCATHYNMPHRFRVSVLPDINFRSPSHCNQRSHVHRSRVHQSPAYRSPVHRFTYRYSKHSLILSYHNHIILIWGSVYRLIKFVGAVWFAIPVHFSAGQDWPLRRASTRFWCERKQPSSWVCNFGQTDTAVAMTVCPIKGGMPHIMEWTYFMLSLFVLRSFTASRHDGLSNLSAASGILWITELLLRQLNNFDSLVLVRSTFLASSIRIHDDYGTGWLFYNPIAEECQLELNWNSDI